MHACLVNNVTTYCTDNGPPDGLIIDNGLHWSGLKFTWLVG